MKRWIKIPKPGEFRGEGKWEPFQSSPNNRHENGKVMSDDEQFKAASRLLPVYEGEEPPQ